MIDWERIAQEYAQGDMGYRALAQAHGLPVAQVAKAGRDGHWPDRRAAYREGAQDPDGDLGIEIQRAGVAQALTVCQLAALLLEKVHDAVIAVEAGDTARLRQLAGTLRDLRAMTEIDLEIDRATRQARLDLLVKRGNDADTRVLEVVMSPELEHYAK